MELQAALAEALTHPGWCGYVLPDKALRVDNSQYFNPQTVCSYVGDILAIRVPEDLYRLNRLKVGTPLPEEPGIWLIDNFIRPYFGPINNQTLAEVIIAWDHNFKESLERPISQLFRK